MFSGNNFFVFYYYFRTIIFKNKFMIKSEKKKKGSLEINGNFDFNFAIKLSPVLRWILVLPIGLVSVLLIQFGYGFIFRLFLENFAENGTVSMIVYSLFAAMKYAAFLISMTAMAPVVKERKFRTGLWLAIIPVILGAGLTLFLVSVADAVDWTMIIYTSLASLVGIIWALWTVYSDVRTFSMEEIQKDVADGNQASEDVLREGESGGLKDN